MARSHEFPTDLELLNLAQGVLEQANFATEALEDAHGRYVLAENAYAIVALIATSSLATLILAEQALEGFLQQRLEAQHIGPKIWDIYLVMLTRDTAVDGQENLRTLRQINYDKRRFRRIARSGVRANIENVRVALAVFVEPAHLQEQDLFADPWLSLSAELVRGGVEKELASRAVHVFRAGGRVEDIV